MSQTVFITGASSGIGKAAAQLFADKGWNVVATMRDPATETALSGRGNVLVTRLDVQDRASVAAAIDAASARFGGIDVLVNNAGFSLFGVFESLSPEKVQEQFSVNVFGLMDVTRAVLPIFRQRGGGTIVNVSSSGGIITVPLLSLYHSTKFAVEGFSESLAYELASQNIFVKLVEPGAVRTNFGQRMSAEFAHDPTLTSYGPFIEQTQELFSKMMSGETSSADQVARVIFEAAMDRSERLRYVVGNDIAPLVKIRREMGEDHYIRFMRSQFNGGPASATDLGAL